MRTVRAWLVGLALAGAVACGGDGGTEPPPPAPRISGQWIGQFAAQSASVTMTMTVVEDAAGSVSGSGSFAVGSGASLAFTTTGAHSFPNVTLTLRVAGTSDATLSGQVATDGRGITGRINGSGFVNEPVTLVRQ